MKVTKAQAVGFVKLVCRDDSDYNERKKLESFWDAALGANHLPYSHFFTSDNVAYGSSEITKELFIDYLRAVADALEKNK